MDVSDVRRLKLLENENNKLKRLVADQALDEWGYRNGVKLDFIDPGKPTQNAYIESFNSILRREFLNDHWFTSFQEARDIIEAWRLEYNRDRPHGSLGDLTPEEFATKATSGLYLAVAQ
jgi:putative transposase